VLWGPLSPPTCCHFISTAKLTALQRRVDVEGRLLNPGHYTYQVLDEAWHDTTQHGRASSRGTQHFHLDFVGLCDHWKTMKACQYLRVLMNCEGQASYRKVVGFTPDHLMSNMPRICVATVMEILEELYIHYEGYFSILVFTIDSYSFFPSVTIYVYTHVCMYVLCMYMYVCTYVTFCCHAISTPQSQTLTVVLYRTSGQLCCNIIQLCRNISAAVP